MGGVYGNKWSLDSMTWLTFASVFALWAFTVSSANLVSEREFGNYKHGRRKLDDIGGSISIDCGILDDFGYIDEKTEIEYISDKDFIDSGENKNISSKFNHETLQKYLWNVRSFPQGNRSCYTIRPHEGKDTTYFIRATFMYGNYDGQDKLPEFYLYIGVNIWDKVKFDNESHIVIKEIIHFSLMDHINVCLLNTGSGTPFISALELRHFHNSSYRIPPTKSLVLYRRFDVGSTTGQIIRYKDDAYDRMWFPYNFPQSIPFNTSSAVDSVNHSEYKLPSMVMDTAVRPMNNDSLDFEVDTNDPTLEFYIYLHFAELEIIQENEKREFNINLNGNSWKESVVPLYLSSTTINSTTPVRGPKLMFSIYKTENSTLPPILNAMEVYIFKDFLQAPTDQEDVNAIMDIKVSNGVTKIWQGDPCLPRPAWDGLNCKDNGYEPPIIISLNLGSSGLTGKISPSMARFKSLEYLDLSNNSLTGPLPEFLSQMPNLTTLNLSGNKLSGSVPSALLERSNNGFLSLSVDGNPDLCVMAPCKKEKKDFVVPLIAATVSALVVLTMLVVCWRCKRKQGIRAAKQLPRTHQGGRPLKSDNRQFTYSEVVSITNNFQKIVGKGGFGTVYHGCLSDGMQVAVKMLSPSSTDGSTQFLTEAQLLMRVHHRNLTSFVGYCNEGTNFGIIYEYMAYGNLAEHLSDKTKDALSWKERLQIAVDAAQGLEYLHHGCKPPIIHRDVKTANILVNEKLQAKIADFGFSKFFTEGQSQLSTAIVGTMGYLDPEYYTSNRLTERSDVYSFGIVLLELITGKRAIIKSYNKDNTNIVDWVSPLLARGDIRNIIDPRMPGNFDTNSVWKAIETAIACVPLISIQRPSMSHVVIELKECLEIEKAYEQDCGPMMKSFNDTFDVNPLGLVMDMVPQAR